MRYAMWADVVARYPAAAKISQAEDSVIEANFIAGAEGEIDAALAARYPVPVSNTPTLAPSLVRDIAIDLSYYKIGLMQLDEDKAARLYDYIQSRLGALAAGSLALVTSGGGITAAVSQGGWGTHASYHNITGVDPTEHWELSSLELSDVEATRSS